MFYVILDPPPLRGRLYLNQAATFTADKKKAAHFVREATAKRVAAKFTGASVAYTNRKADPAKKYAEPQAVAKRVADRIKGTRHA